MKRLDFETSIMNKMKGFLVIIFLSIFGLAEAQSVLTVEDALKIALKNNYGILVASNAAEISKTNNSWGNSGALPSVSLIGNGNLSIQDGKDKSPSGVTTYSGETSKSMSTGVQLSWTLFDGGKMFVSKNKLNEIAALGEIQFKDKVLQTQYAVIAAYFEVVRQKQQLRNIEEIINYNENLVKIFQTSYQAGSVQKSSFLQAKIDLNVYRENSINQQFVIDAAKKSLSTLLCIAVDSTYDVSDTISVNFTFNKDELIQKLESSNTSILSYQKQVGIANLSLKEYQRERFPQISFTAGYMYSQSSRSINNTSGNSIGPQFGGSISIPIFKAGEINRKISIAKLDLKSAEYNFENVKLQAKTDLLNAITQFENQQKLLEIERENNMLTKENLDISTQRLKLGQTTSIEVHFAQENYVQSCTRLINFEYTLKIAETKLKQLLSSF
ncbi:MAG TPA: hypothetical protein DIW31_02315 [Bacteroidales bacterium]|nr:hypothetical protein [Bacteroidales bacterium]